MENMRQMEREQRSVAEIAAPDLADLLIAGGELAVLDVGEVGEYGLGHLLHASSAPYSDLETQVPKLVPNPSAPIVLTGGGDGVSARAASRLIELGYEDVRILAGGNGSWSAAGFELYKGEDVFSKAFGEFVYHSLETPQIAPEVLKDWIDQGRNVQVLDVRTPAEHANVCVPGAIGVPNGELLHRYAEICLDPNTTIVTCCAGRTRSIIGAQTLIDAKVPNRVYALSGGTMGWRMAGFELERGSDRSRRGSAVAAPYLSGLQARTSPPKVTSEDISRHVHEEKRTVYILDVRSADEFAERHLEGAVSAPAGQLVQRLGRWCAVRGGIIALIDDAGAARAHVAAHWLIRMGWDARIFVDWRTASLKLIRINIASQTTRSDDEFIDIADMVKDLSPSEITIIDSSPGMCYRAAHIPSAVWAIRPDLEKALHGHDPSKPIVVYADSDDRAMLAASDIRRGNPRLKVSVLRGGMKAWKDAGHPTESSPAIPADADCKDFLFWVHDRQTGNDKASKEYFEWEHSLLQQIERDFTFRARL